MVFNNSVFRFESKGRTFFIMAASVVFAHGFWMIKLMKFSRNKRADISEPEVLDALRVVKDQQSGADIVAAGMIESIQIAPGGGVIVTIAVDPAQGSAMEPLRQQAEKAVAALKGVTKATAILTAHKPQDIKSKANPDPHGMDKNPRLELPVRHVIVVASGKGGVGKSTISVNLAMALAKNGQNRERLKVGLLDADIYGPSIPLMMGAEGQKPESDDLGRPIPLDLHGLKVMSIGFMLKNKDALIWRGPMVQTAIYQMLRDVRWATKEDPLDVLVIDMPPGTGDAQLTIAQKITPAGAIIVSTPQDIALIDARKAVQMFEKTGVKILGIIENMSTHICTNCGHEEHIFGHGGARKEADILGVPFLGEIPLSAEIREKSDSGNPGFDVFDGIADKIRAALAQKT
jgi:ATP-binding protein involved in chromosome partitioning